MWVQPFNHVVIGMEPGESENLKLWWISGFWHLSNLEDAALLMSFDPIFFEVLVAMKLRCPARQACQHIGWKLRIHVWDPRVELGGLITSRAKNQGRTRRRASEDLGEEWHSGAESIADSADMADDDQPLKLFFVHLEMVLLTSPGAKKGGWWHRLSSEDFHIRQEYDFTSSKSCKHLGKHCQVVQNWRQSNTPDKARTG